MLQTVAEKCVALKQRKSCNGATLFEFAVVVMIFGTLVAILLDRVTYYQSEVERVAVGKLVANMRSALVLKGVADLAKQDAGKQATLVGSNPMLLLQWLPQNYVGEFDAKEAINIDPGNWYFDRTGHKLVYVFISKKSFSGDSYERWNFKVESVRLPSKHAKRDAAPELDGGGVALIQVDQ